MLLSAHCDKLPLLKVPTFKLEQLLMGRDGRYPTRSFLHPREFQSRPRTQDLDLGPSVFSSLRYPWFLLPPLFTTPLPRFSL